MGNQRGSGAARGLTGPLAGILLGVVVAASLVSAPALPASAQGEPCRTAHIIQWISNTDFYMRDPNGAPARVRVAGLAPWREGWPLFDDIVERARDLLPVDAVTLCLRGTQQLANGATVRLADVRLPLNRSALASLGAAPPGAAGSLAEYLLRQGWAQLAPDAALIVPDQIDGLQAAARAAQDGRLGLWAVLDRLPAYRAPGGGTFVADRRLWPALDVLAATPAGAPLLDSLALANVPVFFIPVPREYGAWAYYDSRNRLIGVSEALLTADPRVMAVVLIHEASHADDYRVGRIRDDAFGATTAEACYQTELRAFSNELQLWQRLFGSTGRVPELHALDRETNRVSDMFQTDPDRFDRSLRRLYHGQCTFFRLPPETTSTLGGAEAQPTPTTADSSPAVSSGSGGSGGQSGSGGGGGAGGAAIPPGAP